MQADRTHVASKQSRRRLHGGRFVAGSRGCGRSVRCAGGRGDSTQPAQPLQPIKSRCLHGAERLRSCHGHHDRHHLTLWSKFHTLQELRRCSQVAKAADCKSAIVGSTPTSASRKTRLISGLPLVSLVHFLARVTQKSPHGLTLGIPQPRAISLAFRPT